jgi:rubrerythrin
MFNSELAEFLAHSIELEAEARERYRELAESMATHNNTEVAGFFQAMAAEASKHLAEVEAMVGSEALPEFKPWEFKWPNSEAPETASYEALHYRMGLRQAMELALGNERAAEAYYRQVSETARDDKTAALAREFAAEEHSHAQALEQQIAALAEEPAHGREEDDAPNMPE